MLPKCIICYETVLLPVQMICFSCHSDTDIHCNTFCRICLRCAKKFLQLDLSWTEREFYKKCFFCAGTVVIYNLMEKDAFQFDYTWMQLDNDSLHNCPFCHQPNFSHIGLLRHLKICDQYTVTCECGITLERKDFLFHYAGCPYYEFCSSCSRYLIKTEMDKHQLDLHFNIKCFMCKQYYQSDMMENHLKSYCSHRLLRCHLCNQMVRFYQMETHWNMHEEKILKEINHLKYQLWLKMKEYQLFRRLRRYSLLQLI